MMSRFKQSRLAWLALGLTLGLVVAVLLPANTIHATATDSTSDFTMATGLIDDGIEAVFLLDHLTGDLTATIVNPQTNALFAPNTTFKTNVRTDLKLQAGKEDIAEKRARLQQQIADHAADGRLAELAPVLTFQSVVDFTVSTRAIVNALYVNLPANGSELVLFDINRAGALEPLFTRTVSAVTRRGGAQHPAVTPFVTALVAALSG